MSGELDAAGAAATAGLVASVVDKGEARHAGEGPCPNCDAPLTGRYCANCGQPAHIHRTLLHLLEEALHGIIHFDAKAWRTLPLLVGRPGTLTHNYIHGKRARYISPLAMFLFAVFLMFVTFAFLAPSPNIFSNPQAMLEQASSEELQARLEQTNVELAEVERDIAALDPATPGASGMRTGWESAREGLDLTRIAIETELARRENRPPPEDAARLRSAKDGFGATAVNGKARIDTGNAKLDEKLREKLSNIDLLSYKVQQNAYKFSFLLVPISLPFVALLFLWKRGLTLYDHVVFTLYSLAFMSLLFIAVNLLNLTGWTSWASGWLVLLGAPAHMFFQLKGTYALGWWSALWRTLFLAIFSIVALVIFLAIILIMGLLG